MFFLLNIPTLPPLMYYIFGMYYKHLQYIQIIEKLVEQLTIMNTICRMFILIIMSDYSHERVNLLVLPMCGNP